MMRGWLLSLARDRKGATMVEFALAAPTVLFMSMGLYELGHGMYVQTVVSGVMQDAGRDSTLEGATRTEMRDLLKRTINTLSVEYYWGGAIRHLLATEPEVLD